MTFSGVAESKWQRSHMRGCALSRLYRVSAQSLGRGSTVRYTALALLVQTPPRLTVCPKRWCLCTALQRSQITEAMRARCTSKYAVFHKAISTLLREDAVVHTPSRVYDPSHVSSLRGRDKKTTTFAPHTWRSEIRRLSIPSGTSLRQAA